MSQVSTVAFVADGQIPSSPPPSSEVGPIHWLRANLFSSFLNAGLTLGFIAVIIWLVPPVIQWAFIDGVWAPAEMSLNGCRAESPDGACWAVINERSNQFIFGFYPKEHYWRPLLAFVLLAVALAPVLFDRLPRKMLWFTLAYPVVAYLLILGLGFSGTYPAKIEIWRIALKFLAFPIGAFGYFAAINLLKRSALGQGLESLLAASVSLALFLVWWLLISDELFARILLRSLFEGNLDALTPGSINILEPVETAKIGGVLLTMIIGVVGISGSLPLGIVLALGRKSDMFIVRIISTGFIEFIRGVPLITLLFVASTLLNYFLPKGTNFDLLVRVLIMVTLFASAYMAEVIRGGLAALPPGQYEAAAALGLDYWKSMRLIILPQALKISIPNIVNNFIGLFKDSTLVLIIGMLDPLGIITPIRAHSSWNGIVWELYILVAVFFWIFCFSMGRYSMYLENKLKTDR